MKLKELKEHLKSVPDDYDVKVSSYFVREDQTEIKYFEGDNEKFIPVNDESIWVFTQGRDQADSHYW